MSDRIKLAVLLVVALVALGTLGLVVYNFVANDWRLTDDPLDLSLLFGEDESEPESDDRLVSHASSYGDSLRTIRIESHVLRIRIVRSSSSRTHVRMTLAGDAVDSTRFAWSIVARAGELRIVAAPSGAPGNASGTLELSIPPSLRLIVLAESGDVTAQGVDGNLDLVARTGSIELTGVRGHVRALAGTGDVTLDGCRLEGATLRAGRSVSLSLCEGAVTAEGGEVLARRHFGALDARARGLIRAEILSETAPVRLVSTGGDVSMRVLDGARFAFDVESATGSIVANVPFDSLTTDNATEHTLDASMNGGGVPAMIRAAGEVEILLFEAGEPSSSRHDVGQAPGDTRLVFRDVLPLPDRARRSVARS